ncbi:40S ribosomal protein S10-1 [Diplonema papillatum]|nr:40S ribosomal protein S10-1 [Diplonema papillatum]
MLIATKNREEILQYLFREGVIVAENKNQKTHAVLSVTNLEVIQLMRGYASKGYVKKQYAWRHFYWYLTTDGINHLREVLHIPSDIVPATLKKTARSVGTVEADGRRRQWRGEGEGREGRERRPGGFGRGRREDAPAGEAPAADATAAPEEQAW